MTITAPTPTRTPAPADTTRKLVGVAGALYLITFISSIPALILLGPSVNNPDYIVSAGADTQVTFGILLDIVNALAAVGTAVALFPVLRRHHEASALGFVTTRLMEAAIIMIGVVSLLAVVSLRQDLAGATGSDAATLVTTGHALVEVRAWTFLLGPGLMPSLNALLLGSILYRARLVPRLIPTVGLIGAPLLMAVAVAVMFGYLEQVSVWSGIATLPIAGWELAVGIYMLVKGFKPAAI
jgi:hypothetical protein